MANAIKASFSIEVAGSYLAWAMSTALINYFLEESNIKVVDFVSVHTKRYSMN